MFKILISSLIISLTLFANSTREADLIYLKKCQMCHALNHPTTQEEKKSQAAPNILTVMKNLTIGIDAIEEPKTKEELRELVIEFMKEYIYEPIPRKGYCEDSVYKSYGFMPSLKNFITKEEMEVVIPWVYDTFSPKEE